MADNRIRSVAIVGGGIAGWMAAAALADQFARKRQLRVTLVESPESGTEGVEEATVPQFREFLGRLKINEVDFIQRTSATFRLATGFEGWAGPGTSFFHPFSEHGMPLLGTSFQHWWVKARQIGCGLDLDRYVLSSELARAGRFGMPTGGPSSGCLFFSYALHFDARLVARYLRSWSILAGAKHVEGQVLEARLHPETGDVQSLRLDGDRTLEADLYIDCTGPRGLLIEEALRTGYEDWSHWLPCDRLIAMPCESRTPPAPLTRAIASHAGWQWRVPLQNRTGNGYVYCSRYLSDDEASATLQREVEGPALDSPKPMSFRTGIRRRIWNRNVFCLGSASGFLEPLEATSIHLAQRGLRALLGSFPQAKPNPALQENVNRGNREHWEHIRDFLVLHYKLNRREGEPFWDECRNMPVPDSLAEGMELFRRTGRYLPAAVEFFRPSSWLSLYAGLGVLPEYYHPAVDELPEHQLAAELENMSAGIAAAAARASTHADFLRANFGMKSPVAVPA